MGHLPYSLEEKVIAWSIAIFYLLAIAIYFLIKMLRTPKELKVNRLILRSVALFLLLYIGVRIFYLSSDSKWGSTPKPNTCFTHPVAGFCFSFNFTYALLVKNILPLNIILHDLFWCGRKKGFKFICFKQ